MEESTRPAPGSRVPTGANSLTRPGPGSRMPTAADGSTRPEMGERQETAAMQVDMNTMDISARHGFVFPWSKKAKHLADDEKFTARIPLIKKLSPAARGHVVAVIGEAVGTFLFLFFAYAATLNANSTTDQLVTKNLYISLGFAFSLAVNAWTFFRVSGGLFNPAVTWGMCLVGGITWFRGFLLFITQIVGALVAAGMAAALFPADLSVQTELASGTSLGQGFFIEMFLTIQLVLAIFLLAAEKHKATFIAPIGIGLALFVAELAGVRYTGGSLNPARSFAPAVVNHNFHSYHWIYWVGPLLGSTIAAVIYKLIKVLEYETANPDNEGRQDDDDDEYEHGHARGHAHGHEQELELEKRASSRGNMSSRGHAANGIAANHYSPNEPYTAGPDLEGGRQTNGGASNTRI